MNWSGIAMIGPYQAKRSLQGIFISFWASGLFCQGICCPMLYSWGIWQENGPYVECLTQCRLNEPLPTPQPRPPAYYILEESNFDFRYTRLCDLDIHKEKWLNYLQTAETLNRRRVLWRLIRVCTVRQLPFKGSTDYNGLIRKNRI